MLRSNRKKAQPQKMKKHKRSKSYVLFTPTSSVRRMISKKDWIAARLRSIYWKRFCRSTHNVSNVNSTDDDANVFDTEGKILHCSKTQSRNRESFSNSRCVFKINVFASNATVPILPFTASVVHSVRCNNRLKRSPDRYEDIE